jgi:hypothetical protein
MEYERDIIEYSWDIDGILILMAYFHGDLDGR